MPRPHSRPRCRWIRSRWRTSRRRRWAIDHLIAMGHRRIAIVTGPLTLKNERQRLLGYHQALERAGMRVDPDLVWDGNICAEDVAAMCRERLRDAAGGRTRSSHERSDRPGRAARAARLRAAHAGRYGVRHVRRTDGGRSVSARRSRRSCSRPTTSAIEPRRSVEADRERGQCGGGDYDPAAGHAEDAGFVGLAGWGTAGK